MSNLQIPSAVLADRKPVLDRVLSDLPTIALECIRDALDERSGQLYPGKLYSYRGECVLGAMLRLTPTAPSKWRRRFLRALPRKQGIGCERPELARLLPRLVHLESCFDFTVRMASQADPSHSVKDWAQAAGRWIAASIVAELDRRELAAAPIRLLCPPSEALQAPPASRANGAASANTTRWTGHGGETWRISPE